jgi:putative transposase
MEYKKQSHAVYYTRYHIVISTKYRRKVFKSGVGDYLQKKVFQIGRFYPDIEIIEVKTDFGTGQ